jgi:hypothetical protein
MNADNPTNIDLIRALTRAEKQVAGDLGITVEELRARRYTPDTKLPEPEPEPEPDDAERPRCARCEHPHDRHDDHGCRICRDLVTEAALCTAYQP